MAERQRFSRMAMSLLLIASMLSWGILPPPICHAHEGGEDEGHSHSAFAKPEDRGLNHELYERLQNSFALGVHHHWQLFGIEFSMPCDGEDCDEDEEIGPILIRFSGSTPANGFGGDNTQGTHLIAPQAHGLEPTVVTDSQLRPPQATSSIPLCDSARLERSGVLLV